LQGLLGVCERGELGFGARLRGFAHPREGRNVVVQRRLQVVHERDDACFGGRREHLRHVHLAERVAQRWEVDLRRALLPVEYPLFLHVKCNQGELSDVWIACNLSKDRHQSGGIQSGSFILAVKLPNAARIPCPPLFRKSGQGSRFRVRSSGFEVLQFHVLRALVLNIER